MVERNDDVKRSAGILLARRATRGETNLDACMIAVINVVVRVGVVVTAALDDPDSGGEDSAVAFEQIVLDGGELGNIGVGVRRRGRLSHSDGRASDVVERPVLKYIVGCGQRRVVRRKLHAHAGSLSHDVAVEGNVLAVITGDCCTDVGVLLRRRIADSGYDVVIVLESQSLKSDILQIVGSHDLS